MHPVGPIGSNISHVLFVNRSGLSADAHQSTSTEATDHPSDSLSTFGRVVSIVGCGLLLAGIVAFCAFFRTATCRGRRRYCQL